MKSYIKIYGPPISKALSALRKVAVDTPEVCVMDSSIESTVYDSSGSYMGSSPDGIAEVMTLFGGPDVINAERCDTIISKSGESVGQYDFYYEWFQKPSVSQLEDLISKIDEALTPVGVKYTITTK
jgi:hypothetical protein